jgi:hypothetical protein
MNVTPADAYQYVATLNTATSSGGSLYVPMSSLSSGVYPHGGHGGCGHFDVPIGAPEHIYTPVGQYHLFDGTEGGVQYGTGTKATFTVGLSYDGEIGSAAGSYSVTYSNGSTMGGLGITTTRLQLLARRLMAQEVYQHGKDELICTGYPPVTKGYYVKPGAFTGSYEYVNLPIKFDKTPPPHYYVNPDGSATLGDGRHWLSVAAKLVTSPDHGSVPWVTSEHVANANDAQGFQWQVTSGVEQSVTFSVGYGFVASASFSLSTSTDQSVQPVVSPLLTGWYNIYGNCGTYASGCSTIIYVGGRTPTKVN